VAFTYFFRDIHTLNLVRDHVLDHLRGRREIHIWDAGCAMGPEPYSLAIVLRESLSQYTFRNVTIHATDRDGSDRFGEIIRAGVYPDGDVQRIPADLRARYFEPAAEPGHVRVIDEIRRRVIYTRHDLLTLQPIRGEVQLVLCKNVLLHLQPAERVAVIEMFHATLTPGGYFVTEQTQKLPPEVESKFERVVSSAQLFRKLGAEIAA
jgi:chemotaxis protein methyltransferase CheR